MRTSATQTRPPYRNERSYQVTGFIVFLVILIAVVLIIYLIDLPYMPATPDILTVYCYSAMEPVMNEAILPAFKDHWFDLSGNRMEFITTFSGSGVITHQILEKFPAQVAILSSQLDALQLSREWLVDLKAVDHLPHQGHLCGDPIVFLVHGDSVDFSVELTALSAGQNNLIIPHPYTSGAGQWAALACYGAFLQEGAAQVEALAKTNLVFDGTLHQPSHAGEALEQLKAGMGQLLLTYASSYQELVHSNGVAAYRLHYPARTVVAKPMAVPIRPHITADEEELVHAFLGFLWSDSAQEAFRNYGFHIYAAADSDELLQVMAPSWFSLTDLGPTAEIYDTFLIPFLRELSR